MKHLYLISLLPLLILSACSNPKKNVFEKITKNAREYNSIHFKVDQIYYYKDEVDTTFTPFEVWAVRDSEDSIKNGFVWVDNKYRPYNLIYNRGDFYLVIPPKKTTVYFPKFNESLVSPVDWIDVFLKPENFKKFADDTLNKVTITDTIYDKYKCNKIVILSKPKKDEEYKYTYLVRRDIYMPVFSKLKITKKDYTYFEELRFSDYKFDKITLEEIQAKQNDLLELNPVQEERTEEVTSKELMLHVGDNVPLFNGKFYKTNEDFNLKDYIGKGVFIVDFWYTHCPPCVKAMPALNELYNEYKDKGLMIFGLNSVDNKPNSLDYLDKFLGKRNINYKLVLITPNVDIMYKVNGYPTMYVVGKDGKIAYAEAGYNEARFSRLKEVVDSLMKQ